jgi:oligopeptide/dipeptide ABC transporter ATP-binding protein
MSTLLEVRDLKKDFPVGRRLLHAVNGVSFEIAFGETLALVGESGSGKTTIGRCIADLETPTSGEIVFGSSRRAERANGSARSARSDRNFIGMVFQEPGDSLNPRMSVADIVREPLRVLGYDAGFQRQRLQEVLELVRLPAATAARYPFQLSPNEQQRVGIARALSGSPELIVLDEPTSLLDIATRKEILDLLTAIQAELGLSYLFISHDLMAVRSLSNRVAVMYLGEIVEEGSAERVLSEPMHPYTKALLSSVLVPDPSITLGGYELRSEIPSPIDLPSGCFLHPRCPVAIAQCRTEHPDLVRAGDDGSSVACWLATAENSASERGRSWEPVH